MIPVFIHNVNRNRDIQVRTRECGIVSMNRTNIGVVLSPQALSNDNTVN